LLPVDGEANSGIPFKKNGAEAAVVFFKKSRRFM
jgi:hypothetical protein